MPFDLIPCADCKRSFQPNAGNQDRCRSCGDARAKIQALANQLVREAVRHGRLVPQVCEVCGNETTEAHHDDYGRPLMVRWLCKADHEQHHAIERLTAVAP